MGHNEGTVDRILRAVLGALLILLPLVSGIAFFANSYIMAAAVILGVVLVLTGATGYCPIYRVLGVRTCRP
jgi:hypothetical protein